MESIIESLEKFGLTRYEAKAYIGMTNLISGKAEEIARASEIPRSKISIQDLSNTMSCLQVKYSKIRKMNLLKSLNLPRKNWMKSTMTTYPKFKLLFGLSKQARTLSIKRLKSLKGLENPST